MKLLHVHVRTHTVLLYAVCVSYIFFNVSDVRIVPQLLATPTLICLQ